MKKLVTTFSLILITLLSFGQSSSSNAAQKESEKVRDIAAVMPSFPGGYAKMNEYIDKNLRYPMEDRKANISGTSVVTFIVEKDGSLSNVKVTRPILNAKGCNSEAIRIVNSMPKWIPAKEEDKIVRLEYTVFIKFTLK